MDRSAAWPCSKQRQAVSVGSTGPCGHASVCPRWWQAAAGELASVAVSEMAQTACLGSGMGSAFANSLRRQQRNVCTSFQLFFSATRQDHGVGHRAQTDGAPVWLAPSPTWPADTLFLRGCKCFLLRRSLPRPVSACQAHRTAAVPQLGARRLLPHQRQSRKALHVVNYVTEHAPVSYKEMTIGEWPAACGPTLLLQL